MSSAELDIASNRRLHELCRTFEFELRATKQPMLEDWMQQADERLHGHLFEELLDIEFTWLTTQGRSLDLDGYHVRFPDRSDVIRETAARCLAAETDRGEADDHQTSLHKNESFHGRLLRCGLLTQQHLDAAIALDPTCKDSPTELASRLVTTGALNSWQADVLLKGRSKPLLIGSYELLDQIGHGGMGQVYLALDRRMKRRVALKQLRGVLADDERSKARFEREIEATARLRHPNIVQIFEVGEAAGTPWLAMELVDGPNLAEFASNQQQPVKLAARIIESISLAISHAHRQGIVHRDLKPANILLAAADESGILGDSGISANEKTLAWMTGSSAGDGGANHNDSANGSSANTATIAGSAVRRNADDLFPRVVDFGLARLIDDVEGHTLTGEVLGTAKYMPPEQAAGRIHEIGPLSDVYGLGAILYELLTGRPPFQGDTVLETLAQVSDQPPVSPTQLRPGVPKDLETICLKCLRKEPTARYGSADELADELRRFLEDRPIVARPAGVVDKTVRWCRRNPIVAALSFACVTALLLGLAGTSWKWREATHLGRTLQSKNSELTTAQSELEDAAFDAKWTNARLVFDAGRGLADSGKVTDGLFQMLESLQLAQAASTQHVSPKMRIGADWRWHAFDEMVRTNLSGWIRHVPERVQVLPQDFQIMCAAIGPNDQRLVVGTSLGAKRKASRLRQFDLRSGVETAEPIEVPNRIHSLTFHPLDERVLAVGLASNVMIFDLKTATIQAELKTVGTVNVLKFDPSGKRLLAVCHLHGSSEHRFWDTTNYRELRDPLVREWDQRIHAHPSGDLYWLLSPDGLQKVPDLGPGAVDDPIQIANLAVTPWGRSIWFHPDGKKIVAVQKTQSPTFPTRVSLIDLATAQEIRTIAELPFSEFTERGIQITNDGRTMFSRGPGAIFVHNVATGRSEPAIRLGDSKHRNVVSDSRGEWLVANEWKLRRHRRRSRTAPLQAAALVEPILQDVLREQSHLRTVAWHPDDASVLTMAVDPSAKKRERTSIRWRDVRSNKPLGGRLDLVPRFNEAWMAFSRDASRLVIVNFGLLRSVGPQTFVKISHHDLGGLTASQVSVPRNFLQTFAVDSNGSQLAVCDLNGVVCIDLEKGSTSHDLPVPGVGLRLAYSLDGSRLAVAYEEPSKTVRIMMPSNIMSPSANTPTVQPAGATSSDHETGQTAIHLESSTTPAIEGTLFHFDYLTNGNLLCAAESRVQLWQADDNELCYDIPSDPAGFQCLDVDEAAGVLAIGSRSGSVEIHDLLTGQHISSTRRHQSPVVSLSIQARRANSGIAGRLVVGLANGTIHVHDLATNKTLGPPVVHLRPVVALRITADGSAFDSVSTDGDIRRWPMPQPVDGTLEELRARVQLWTGCRATANGERTTMSPTEWQSLHDSLAPETLARRMFNAIDEPTWHNARARDAEQDDDAFGAHWHRLSIDREN